jgi:hypothetical protein
MAKITELTMNTPTRKYSTEELERLVGPTAARTRRTARNMSVGFLITGFFIATGLGFVMLRSGNPAENLHDDLIELMLFFVFFGVAPALAVSYVMLRDVSAVPYLMRYGKSYAGRLESHGVRVTGMHRVRVSWEEDGHECGAHFDVETLPAQLSKELEVRAILKQVRVAVIFADRIEIAVRDARKYSL